MKKIILPLCLLWPMLGLATDNIDISSRYFSKSIPRLSQKENQALNIGRRYQKGNLSSKPFKSSDGAISYVYGQGQIRVVCAPLQVCDIALEPGETFNDMNVGDPRFIVEPSITGEGMNQQIHILVKPKDVGLNSSLVVTTNKRTYHFNLKSDRYDFMPYVSFIYPGEARAKWRMIQRMQAARKKENTFAQTNEYLGNLNFNYRLSGSAKWKPVRIYNDGIKTIIEMPKVMSQTEAPALLVKRSKGFFSKSESVMVNYRLQGCRYIVDFVFDKAVLIVGSGSSQQQVTITRC